jgi:holin-like protein
MWKSVGLLFAALGLVGLQWVGDAIARFTGWPVPGAVIGALFLLVLLFVFGRVPEALDRVSIPLLRHLMLFLIPSVVGAMTQVELIEELGVVLVSTIVLGTCATALVTSAVLKAMLHGKRRT